jgi:2-methylisocitrate lyase-like PEP mutase family enzyme
MGGNATTASRLGLPDLGLLTLTEMVDQAGRIVEASGLPLVVDADTGYGGALNVRRSVREFERVGVAGIHIEDQGVPKKCGHFEGKILVSTDEMVGKIRAAVDARLDSDFIVIGRTDAIAVEGVERARERAEAYKSAGADMLMFAPPCDESMLAQVRASAPLLCIMDTSGRTPVIPASELAPLGVKIVAMPTAITMAIIPVVRRLLQTLKRDEHLKDIQGELATFAEYHALLGLSGMQALERRYQLHSPC